MGEWAEYLIVLPFLAAGIYVVIAKFTGMASPRLLSIACYCVSLSLFVAAFHYMSVDPPALTIFYVLCSFGLLLWGVRLQSKRGFS